MENLLNVQVFIVTVFNSTVKKVMTLKKRVKKNK